MFGVYNPDLLISHCYPQFRSENHPTGSQFPDPKVATFGGEVAS